MSKPKTKITVSEAKVFVLASVIKSCMDDKDFMYDMLLWAFRDYTDENWTYDFLDMEQGADDLDYEVVPDKEALV